MLLFERIFFILKRLILLAFGIFLSTFAIEIMICIPYLFKSFDVFNFIVVLIFIPLGTLLYLWGAYGIYFSVHEIIANKKIEDLKPIFLKKRILHRDRDKENDLLDENDIKKFTVKNCIIGILSIIISFTVPLGYWIYYTFIFNSGY